MKLNHIQFPLKNVNKSYILLLIRLKIAISLLPTSNT